MRILALLLLATPLQAKTYAVVIGNNAPPALPTGEPLAELRFADDDATRFYELFSRLGAEVTLLSVLDSDSQRRYAHAAEQALVPSLDNLRQVLQRYRTAMAKDREAGEPVSFFLTFSGHGARSLDGETFLAMTDGGLTERLLYDELLAALPATYVHLLVDACNAGAVVGVRGRFDRQLEAEPVALSSEDMAQASRLQKAPAVGVLVATTAGQQAHEWSEVEAGVFSHELLSALSGAADVNGDGAIEYSEVAAFVAAANRDLKDPRAVPHLVARPPRLNQRAVLVRLTDFTGAAVLTGRPEQLGSFFVELDNGERYLDANLSAELQAHIALPAGPLFVRTSDREARLQPVAGQRVAFSELSFAPRRSDQRGSIEASFHRDLFASPYGVAYYRGFVDQSGDVAVELSPPPALVEQATPVVSTTLFSAAGALLLGAGASAYVAHRTRADFEATELQRPAHHLADRYRLATGIAAGSALLGVLAATAGWYFLPVPAESAGADGLSMGVTLAW